MNIEIKKDDKALTIYFDDLVHLYIKLDTFVGFQSWLTHEYFIDYYFTGSTKISSAYTSREVWIDVLKKLESCNCNL